MRHDKIIPGAILITLGLIFLLQSFGLLHIHWGNILYLWPIFLLIGGINLIFANNRAPWASALKIGVVILGLGILLFGDFENTRRGYWPNFVYRYDSDNNDDDDDDNDNGKQGIVRIEGNSTFNEPMHADARIAKLSISGGVASYTLNDTTNQLFQAYTKEFNGNYQFTHRNEDSVYVLDFGMKKNTEIKLGRHNKSNTASFKLNAAPIWDIDMQTGAAEVKFDLSKFKIRKMDINGGAASFDIKLGQPLTETKLDITTGAAEIKIRIPKDAACKIITDSGLSQKDFQGFTKISDDHYETPGFAAATNKIFIKFDGAISDFKVTRY